MFNFKVLATKLAERKAAKQRLHEQLTAAKRAEQLMDETAIQHAKIMIAYAEQLRTELMTAVQALADAHAVGDAAGIETNRAELAVLTQLLPMAARGQLEAEAELRRRSLKITPTMAT